VHKSEDVHWVRSDGTAIGVKNIQITSTKTYFAVCIHKSKCHEKYPGYDFPGTALADWLITVKELEYTCV
jgi:hypothetical protein